MKNKKSIFLTILLILVLMFSVLTIAHPLDVGNTNDYDIGSDWGDSDWGSSSDWGDDSSYSGDGTGDFGSFGGIVGIIVFIAIVFFIIKASKGKGTTTGTRNTISTAYPSVTDNTSVIADKIKEEDPNFSSEKFIGWTKETFMTLQAAWTTRDWSKIRPFEKEELFKQHETQLEEYKRLGRINIIERVDIRQAYLNRYTCDGNYEYLTVFMKARMGDYIIDEKTRAVLKGDSNAEYELPYLIGFMRRKGVKTDVNLSGHSVTNCPNCGAPTSVTSAGKCDYCGSVITSGEFDWVMYRYEGVKPGMNINNAPFDN